MHLVLEKSKVHNKEKWMEIIYLDDCFEMENIKFVPIKVAKRLSSLGNSVLHQL
jgi:hypothetical protein